MSTPDPSVRDDTEQEPGDTAVDASREMPYRATRAGSSTVRTSASTSVAAGRPVHRLAGQSATATVRRCRGEADRDVAVEIRSAPFVSTRGSSHDAVAGHDGQPFCLGPR